MSRYRNTTECRMYSNYKKRVNITYPAMIVFQNMSFADRTILGSVINAHSTKINTVIIFTFIFWHLWHLIKMLLLQ